MKKQNYNPNSAKHNDDWHNEYNEEWEYDHYSKDQHVPKHRRTYYFGTDFEEEFNSTCNFLHKLDELPEEANVPPEMLKDALNAIVGRLNSLTDERNSIEEYEFNKIKARQKQEQAQARKK